MTHAPDAWDRAFGGFLFDMDGTILNSLPASMRVWRRWAAGFGLDGAAILKGAHGMQVRDVVAGLALPGIDVARETEAIFQAELADTDDVVMIPGAADFLASLPGHRWAVVTSAPRPLAMRRLAAAGLPSPPTLVGAEDAARGKPDPQSYRIAADRLGIAAARCVAFEDAPAGIAAARGAGAFVVAITAAQGASPAGDADLVLRDYRGLGITPAGDDRWRVTRR